MKRITKILTAIILLIACLASVSCGKRLDMDGKDKDWMLVMVSNNKTGKIEYASIEYAQDYLAANDGEVKLDAKIIDLGFKASDGKFAIIDRNMQMQYAGIYTVENKYSEGTDYNITLDYEGEIIKGSATVTETKLHDDTKEYTLILVIDGMTFYFKSLQ